VSAPSRLPRSFFARETSLVARALLGTRLVSEVGGVRVAGTIVECEAYVQGDSTNHAFRGRTPRNTPMFDRPGTAYVYFTYGMHFCLNLVTEDEGVGTAVLLRAIEPTEGVEVMRARRGPRPAGRDLCRGPARLCVALGVDRAINGIDTCAPDALVFVEQGAPVPDAAVAMGPRVGVVGRPHDVQAPLRFFLAGSPFVSPGPRR
jgi:DNA-3-methyladenine glycosylase